MEVVVLLVYVALLGLLIGSFSNVVIYRVPLHQSLISPASHCPHCDREIRYRDNVPLLSWVMLRGRCAHCSARISARYPLVEAGTCALFVALTLRLDALGQIPALPAYLYFAAVGIVLALIDVDSRRLPDVIIVPSYGILLLLLSVAAGWQGDWTDLQRALVGGAALYLLYYAIAFAYPAGMGFGDVKLSAMVGGVLAFLSWGTLVVGAFSGFLLGSIVGVAVMAWGGGTRKSALPFGPFMICGALVGIFCGAQVTNAYLHVIGRA